MPYISKTFSYMAKSARLLVPIAILPALLLGMFVKPLGFITFLPLYAVTDVKSFSDIAWLIFDKYAVTHVYPMILIFVVLTLCCAFSLSVIEKHFRIGKLMIKAPFKDVNSSLFPVLKTLFVLTAVYFVWKFVLCGIATLLHFVISGAGVPNWWDIVILSLVITALFLLLMYFGMPAVFWAPLMLTFGYSFVDAFIESMSLARKAGFKLYIALMLPFVVVIMLQCVVSFLPLPIIALKAISVLLYLFLIVYLVSFMMNATFELTGLERRDIKKKYI